MTPTDLLALAQQLLARPDAKTGGLWPRAAALLTRQALEQALDEYWQAKGLRVDECSTTAQLLCLTEYMNDADIALEAHHLWSALSRACHHHPYELAPTAGELEGWLGTAALMVSPRSASAIDSSSSSSSEGLRSKVSLEASAITVTRAPSGTIAPAFTRAEKTRTVMVYLPKTWDHVTASRKPGRSSEGTAMQRQGRSVPSER